LDTTYSETSASQPVAKPDLHKLSLLEITKEYLELKKLKNYILIKNYNKHNKKIH